MNKSRKKASYGKMKKMRGGDYMEPNKELKFGGPSNRVKARKGRRRAVKGEEAETGALATLKRVGRNMASFPERASENWSKMKENMRNYGKDSTYGNSSEANRNTSNTTSRTRSSNTDRDAATASGNRVTTQRATGSQAGVKAKTDSKGNQIIGTADDIKKIESIKAKSKSNPYAEAKKRDSNLDSLVKERNRLRDSGKKNSGEYNAVQNKINKAYGKGPTDRPTSSGKTNVASLNTRGTSTSELKKTQIENKYAPEQKLQVSTSKPSAKPAAEPTGRAKKIADKGKERAKKIEDRRASAKNRKDARDRKDTARQAAKDSGATRGQVRAAGKMAKAGVKGKDKKFDRQFENYGKRAKTEKPAKPETPSRSERRAPIKKAKLEKRNEIRKARGKEPRKKAVFGTGIIKKGLDLAASIAPEGSFVNKAATTGQAVLENPAKAAVNLIKGQPVAGGDQTATPAAGAAPAAAPAAATQPAATGQPVQQQTMKKGGKKRKMMGGKKMKYKTGGLKGAKPDYLDFDKDGNKTEPMKSALPDRRNKARYGKKK